MNKYKILCINLLCQGAEITFVAAFKMLMVFQMKLIATKISKIDYRMYH